jgi:hypothetical protein
MAIWTSGHFASKKALVVPGKPSEKGKIKRKNVSVLHFLPNLNPVESTMNSTTLHFYLHPTVVQVSSENAKEVPKAIGVPGGPKPQSVPKLTESIRT